VVLDRHRRGARKLRETHVWQASAFEGDPLDFRPAYHE